jgi:cellulose synthase/poly-beta-1,6-N-acetylglucosamine synthase-like glycosyltransferase
MPPTPLTPADVMLLVAGALLLVPCLVLLGQCLAAALPAPRPRPVTGGVRPRTAIVIPAHDEAAGIGATVAGLLPELGPGDRLIVVADNCTDATAEVARAAGATVIERSDRERRGKGFAIAHALEHLDADPPQVVVLVDADCRLSPTGGVARLAELAHRRHRPVQAEYLLSATPAASPLGVVGGLAVLVRNRVRPRGMARLGLPCQLTGSGMAFPWQVLRHAPETGSNLVEDLVMGLQMALAGDPPLGCPEVQISSELPEGDQAARKQRRRWEHGQLATLVKYGPRLILAGVARARLDLIGLGLDLIVPPLALLVMMLGSFTSFATVTSVMGWTAWLPALVGFGAFGALSLAVGAAWLKFGRQTLPFRFLVVVPFYVLWKVPLYLSLFFGGKQRTWERTARKGEAV